MEPRVLRTEFLIEELSLYFILNEKPFVNLKRTPIIHIVSIMKAVFL